MVIFRDIGSNPILVKMLTEIKTKFIHYRESRLRLNDIYI